jgi:hypothetical protein
MKTLKRIKPNGYLTKNMKENGTCFTCLFNFEFCEHRQEESKKSKLLSEIICSTVQNSRNQSLQKIAAKFELESDEFFTSEQKAEFYIFPSTTPKTQHKQ